MAEQSIVMGTISFPIEFYDKYSKEIIEAYGEELCGVNEYGFWLENINQPTLSKDTITFQLGGAGRWCLVETLKCSWCFTRTEEITQILLNEKPTLKFHYKDYELSGEMLIEQEVTVTFAEGVEDERKVILPKVEADTINDVYPSVANCHKWGFIEATKIDDVQDTEISELYNLLANEEKEELDITSESDFKKLFVDLVNNYQKFEGYIDDDNLSMYEHNIQYLLDDIEEYRL